MPPRHVGEQGDPAELAINSRPRAETASSRPDDELVGLIAAHDGPAEAALAALYDRYCRSIYSLCLRMLGDAALAEDVTQEAFWRLWLHARSYEPGRVRFATWLMRIASNLAISELRRAARRPRPANSLDHAGDENRPAPENELGDPSADVPEIVWLAEQRRLVSGGLAALPDVQRQAVELAYFGGLTHAEIASVQGAPLSTVKTRLALGLHKLATYVTAQGLTRKDALR